MTAAFDDYLKDALATMGSQGLRKVERLILSPQSAHIQVRAGGCVRDEINLCANNYLGLANDRRLIEAAKASLDTDGFGMASVRFICGTRQTHRELEQALAKFLGKDDAILFAACFDANGGLFEPLLGPDDAIVSDALNHASIIDGIRLCKAKRYRYANGDMNELETRLKEAKADGARFTMIATDGVFSMDGYLAQLPQICALAQTHDALVMVDDCHATGFMGAQGRGTHYHHGVQERVDVLTGTLGKALGGAIGGYVAASQPTVDMLRQRARPYLFSNALPPMVVAAALEALRIVEAGDDLRRRLFDNTRYWREGLNRLGFELLEGEHPIVPVMLGDAQLAQKMAAGLFDEGIYTSGFFYPVVPHGQARIRTQMNATLDRDDLDAALGAFWKVGKALGVI